MKRLWLKLNTIQIYDDFHTKDGDGYVVNQELDGNTTEYHQEGVKVIKQVLGEGLKIRPILVQEHVPGEYKLLDGFKRARAHEELGMGIIEAFVCSNVEVDHHQEIPYENDFMYCSKGGQRYEKFGLFEAGAKDEEILYWNGKTDGLRIEVSEMIHVHWGNFGRYRFALGRRDFLILAEAIASIDG